VGETTDQIESRIEDSREDLRSNLQELEQKVKSVTDWRRQFQNHPTAMISAAFGGGLLLARILRKAERKY
jgi:hypothetical protein